VQQPPLTKNHSDIRLAAIASDFDELGCPINILFPKTSGGDKFYPSGNGGVKDTLGIYCDVRNIHFM
jgi:hypothetical protein